MEDIPNLKIQGILGILECKAGDGARARASTKERTGQSYPVFSPETMDGVLIGFADCCFVNTVICRVQWDYVGFVDSFDLIVRRFVVVTGGDRAH